LFVCVCAFLYVRVCVCVCVCVYVCVHRTSISNSSRDAYPSGGLGGGLGCLCLDA
jgi:hypothetical protein